MTKCFWLFVQNHKIQLFYINVTFVHLQFRENKMLSDEFYKKLRTSLLLQCGNGPSQTRVSLSQYTSRIGEKQPRLHWQWRTSAPDMLASSSLAKGTVFSVAVIGHTSVSIDKYQISYHNTCLSKVYKIFFNNN